MAKFQKRSGGRFKLAGRRARFKNRRKTKQRKQVVVPV